jgi:type I restriction enzyme M protein
MRRKMIEDDQVEAVIGLGPNLFYNSPMEACLLVTRTRKSPERQGKILFINAVKEVRQDKTMGYLDPEHIERIYRAYENYTDEADFAVLVDKEYVLEKNGNMNISLYVRPDRMEENHGPDFTTAFADWEESSKTLSKSMKDLFATLEN